MKRNLTHLDEEGKARMVDIGLKEPLRRRAKASGFIAMAPDTLELVRNNQLAKGDALAAARIAGIMGAKETARLIPLCHNIEIASVTVDFDWEDEGIRITSEASCVDRTGIEMEALIAVSVAALTLYDMTKSVDKTMVIKEIYLVNKTKEPL